ncbi:MAG: hypothetical protein AAGB12_15165 [Pseudomonadota bacterium]
MWQKQHDSKGRRAKRGIGYLLLILFSPHLLAELCEEKTYINDDQNIINDGGTIGTEKIIGVTFFAHDSSIDPTDKVNQLRCFFNQPGYSRDGNQGSIRDYWMKVSKGQVDARTYVIPVKMPEPMNKYQRPKDSNDYSFDQTTVGFSLGVLFNNSGPSNDFIVEVLKRREATLFFSTMKNPNLSNNPYQPLSTDILTLQLPRLPGLSRVLQSVGSEPDVKFYIKHYRYISIIYDRNNITDECARPSGSTMPVDCDRDNSYGLWPSAKPYGWNDNASENIALIQNFSKVEEGDDVAIGAVHLQAFMEDVDFGETALSLGVMTHEKGHQLFQWPDLYSVFDKGNGIGGHGLMGVVGNPKNPPWPSPFLRDKQGWPGAFDLTNFNLKAFNDTSLTLGLKADDGSSFKYCNQKSYTNECFYIEARKVQSTNNPNLADGMVIWHTEDWSLTDPDVNNAPVQFKADGSPNLSANARFHNAVYVVQADGNYDLDKLVNQGDTTDAFGLQHGATEFSFSTSPSSAWWDGSPSHLALKNISDFNSDDIITFEFSDTQPLAIYYAGNDGITLNNPQQTAVAGEEVDILYTLDPDYEIDAIHLNGEEIDFDQDSLASSFTFIMPRDEADIVFFSKRKEGEVFYLHPQIYTDPGVKVIAYTPYGKVTIGDTDGDSDAVDRLSGFSCQYSAVPEVDGCDTLPPFLTTEQIFFTRAFRVETQEGYILKNLHTNDLSSSSLLNEIPLQNTPLYSAPENNSLWRIRARAEPERDFYCNGNVLEWDINNIDSDNDNDTLYKRIGTIVRHNDVIYKNMVMNNPTVFNDSLRDTKATITPGTNESRHAWMPIAHCSGSPNAALDCQASDIKDYYASKPNEFNNGDKVLFMGNVYEVDAAKPESTPDRPESNPGSFHFTHTYFADQALKPYLNRESDIDFFNAMHLFTVVDPIIDDPNPYYKTRSDWKLIGRCAVGTDSYNESNPFHE